MKGQNGLADDGANGFTEGDAHDIAGSVQVEYEDGKLVVPAHGDGSGKRSHSAVRAQILPYRACVAVMRRGEILENRPTSALFQSPQHAYTAELKAAIPLPEVDRSWLAA